MLTRLKVSGFKNLVEVDVRMGPFTCIAGVNGVGKSNIFDAIQFLSLLTTHLAATLQSLQMKWRKRAEAPVTIRLGGFSFAPPPGSTSLFHQAMRRDLGSECSRTTEVCP